MLMQITITAVAVVSMYAIAVLFMVLARKREGA